MSSTSAVVPLDPIVIKGSHFFYKTNGTQFFIRGVVYRSPYFIGAEPQTTDYYDLFTDPDQCTRDIHLMVALGINLVRVYDIESTVDHAPCMTLFQQAQIYVIVSLQYVANSTEEGGGWSNLQYSWATAIIDIFQSYTNVLGFLVADGDTFSDIMPNDNLLYIKAAVRDVKGYIRWNNYRDIPVGTTLAYEINEYQLGAVGEFWCDSISTELAGFKNVTSAFESMGVPLFFSEYACGNIPSPFSGNLVDITYSPNVSAVWSGGITYQWYTPDVSGALQGLVNMTSDGNISILPAYTSLSTQLASVSLSIITASTYIPTSTQSRSCSTSYSTSNGTSTSLWLAAPTLPPSPNLSLCSCMISSLACSVLDTIPDAEIDLVLPAVERLGGSSNTVGIDAGPQTGRYGAYSVCDRWQQLSWVLNKFHMDKLANGNDTACNITTFARLTTPQELDPTCSSLVSAAGPLGNQTVLAFASQATNIKSLSVQASSSSSSMQAPSGSGDHRLAPGVLAGIVIAVLAAFGFIVGVALWVLKRHQVKTKHERNISPDGLEVDNSGIEHGPKAELSAEPQTAELWTSMNTTELPSTEFSPQQDECAEGVHIPLPSNPEL